MTCLSISLSSTHLLVGTQAGEIHVHSLPSHQHLRTITAHSSPITHLSSLLRPPDLVGSGAKPDSWPVMEIKPLERMRMGKTDRDVQEVTILLHPSRAAELESLRPARPQLLAGERSNDTESSGKLAAVMADNKQLRSCLDRAVKINERMWNGIVDLQLSQPDPNGHAS